MLYSQNGKVYQLHDRRCGDRASGATPLLEEDAEALGLGDESNREEARLCLQHANQYRKVRLDKCARRSIAVGSGPHSPGAFVSAAHTPGLALRQTSVRGEAEEDEARCLGVAPGAPELPGPQADPPSSAAPAAHEEEGTGWVVPQITEGHRYVAALVGRCPVPDEIDQPPRPRARRST